MNKLKLGETPSKKSSTKTEGENYISSEKLSLMTSIYRTLRRASDVGVPNVDDEPCFMSYNLEQLHYSRGTFAMRPKRQPRRSTRHSRNVRLHLLSSMK